MSLTRKLKREYERKNRKKDMKALYAHLDLVAVQQEARLRKEYQNAALDENTQIMTMALYYLFGIKLHELFNFGQDECLPLFQAVDNELGIWQNSEFTIDDLRLKLKDAIDIDIEFK